MLFEADVSEMEKLSLRLLFDIISVTRVNCNKMCNQISIYFVTVSVCERLYSIIEADETDRCTYEPNIFSLSLSRSLPVLSTVSPLLVYVHRSRFGF